MGPSPSLLTVLLLLCELAFGRELLQSLAVVCKQLFLSGLSCTVQATLLPKLHLQTPRIDSHLAGVYNFGRNLF